MCIVSLEVMVDLKFQSSLNKTSRLKTLGNVSTMLRITGIKESVVWNIDNKDDKPVSWSAGIGVEGLVPDLVKGYKYKYTRELISPDGKIVDTGILSQAPGCLGTSTTFVIGRRGLSPGNYTVRVWSDNDEEDNMTLIVPDFETWISTKKQEEIKSKTVSLNQETKRRIKNSSLQFVNEVYLQEDRGAILLTVERKNGSKYSTVLKDPGEVPCIDQVIIDDENIEMIRKSLTVWGDRIDKFVEQYLKDDRKEIELFNDIVTLARCLSQLPSDHQSILKFGAATDLLHNRIMAQIIYEYHNLGFHIKLTSTKNTGQKIHDFDASICNVTYKCEVKTVQSIGELEHRPEGGYRLTDSSYKTIISKMRDHLEDAKKNGNTDVVIIAPWSYRINALLSEYFKKELLVYPPPPYPNITILVLTSDHVFEDYYVSFPTKLFLSIIEACFSFIQKSGIGSLIQNPIRKGLTIRISPASGAGSVAGYSFKPPKKPE